MLSVRAREQEQQHLLSSGTGHSAGGSSGEGGGGHADERQKQASDQLRAVTDYANRPGLTVTKTYKQGGQLMLTKEVVKATVFGDRIAPPSMSLEEFADKEVADARAREASQVGTIGRTAEYVGHIVLVLLLLGSRTYLLFSWLLC